MASVFIMSGIHCLRLDLVLCEGQYYPDESLMTLYIRRYTEFYPDGMLKMELYLEDGRPEGGYVVYFSFGKIAEVYVYYKGKFHGIWRPWYQAGALFLEVEYMQEKQDVANE